MWELYCVGLHCVGVALGISHIVRELRYTLVAVCRIKIVGGLPCGGGCSVAVAV